MIDLSHSDLISGKFKGQVPEGGTGTVHCDPESVGRYLYIHQNGYSEHMHICQVEVLGSGKSQLLFFLLMKI